jgi:hypothetical protein
LSLFLPLVQHTIDGIFESLGVTPPRSIQSAGALLYCQNKKPQTSGIAALNEQLSEYFRSSCENTGESIAFAKVTAASAI